jgi:hypothetical protein
VRADWATKILWTASEKSAELAAANAAMSEGSKAKLLETNRFQDPSIINLKPAIRYQFKTGQRDWPKT